MIRITFILVIAVALAIASQPQSDRTSRILGGRNVGLGELPYQAALFYWGTTFHFAGGILVNSRWVVTTAHGLIGRPANSINIVLGVVRLDVPFTNRQSAAIRIHGQYNSVTRENDIATVQTAAVINFSNNILPIDFSPSFVSNGIVGHVSGWGATNADKSISPAILQLAFVTVGPCENTEFITFNPLQHFCAGRPASGGANEPVVGICTSDVGGPLVLNNMAIGIPFYHDPRECGRHSDGYLRISAFRPWILGNTPL